MKPPAAPPGASSTSFVTATPSAERSSALFDQVSSAVAETIHEPDVAKRFADMSASVVGDTPAETAVFLQQERERWGKVIRASGAKAE